VGLLSKLFGRGDDRKPSRPQPDTIKVYDSYGREMEIPRDQWRLKILPDAIKSNWSNADALYSTLVQALDDGFVADIRDAAKRLREIDGDAERGGCVYGIVLLENGDLRRAESVLNDALQKAPRSGPLLTNLAKVYQARGDALLAEQTLWRALNADPNFDNALLWYTALERERGGDAARIAALKRVAGLRGSWRANLWLARLHLEAKELDQAVGLYENILVVAADQPGVLKQISGDLGQNGYIDQIIRLVLPFYDPKRHDFLAGSNLLQAFLELGDVERGEKLLHDLMLLDLAPYREHLMWYSSRFADLKAQPPVPEPIGEIEVSILPLDQPVWTNGLGDVGWLLPERMTSTKDIAVLAFTLGVEPNELLREGEALAGREDEPGRLSRAIPLHLTDVLRFRTDAAPVTLLPVIRGKGMVVSGQEWSAEAVHKSCGEQFAYAITGHLTRTGETLQVGLAVWSAGDDKPLARLACAFEQCETELLSVLVARRIVVRREPAALFRVPEQFRKYLAGLGQLFALAMSRWDMSDTLYGERNIHRWLLALALADDLSPVPKIGFAAALANSRRRGSDVYRESEREALTMFGSVKRSEPDLYRITPAVFRLFDRMDEFEKRRNELMAGADDRYIRWLASLDTLFEPATNS